MGLYPRKFYLGDGFFDDFFEPSVKNDMKCDVYEKDGNYHFEIDMPGFEKEQIEIDYDNGYLTITAEKIDEKNDEGKNYIRRERYQGKFSRSFYVGDVNTQAIDAEFSKGTLKICVPKVEEKPSKKNIEIK